jgi:hypothetical protein
MGHKPFLSYRFHVGLNNDGNKMIFPEESFQTRSWSRIEIMVELDCQNSEALIYFKTLNAAGISL